MAEAIAHEYMRLEELESRQRLLTTMSPNLRMQVCDIIATRLFLSGRAHNAQSSVGIQT